MTSVTFTDNLLYVNRNKLKKKLVKVSICSNSQALTSGFKSQGAREPWELPHSILGSVPGSPCRVSAEQPRMLALTMPPGFCSGSTEGLALRLAALIFWKTLSVFSRNQAGVHSKETKSRSHSCRRQLSCAQLWHGWKTVHPPQGASLPVCSDLPGEERGE